MISFLLLFFVAALRSQSIGYDNSNYESFFYDYGSYSLPDVLHLTEPLFYLLNKILLMMGGDFQTLMAAVAGILLISVFVFLKNNSDCVWMSLWFFITMFFYQGFFTYFRQAVATGMILLAYDALIKDKNLRYMILIAIAFFFHNTSIVAAVALPIYYVMTSQIKIRFSREKIVSAGYAVFLFAVPVIFIVYFLREPVYQVIWDIVRSRFLYWSNARGEYLGHSGLLLVYIAMMFFIAMQVFRWRTDDEQKRRRMMFLLMCSMLSVAVQMFSSLLPVLLRMTYYFSLPMFLLFPNLLTANLKKKSMMQLFTVGAMGAALVLYVYQMRLDMNVGEGSSIPYRFYFMD